MVHRRCWWTILVAAVAVSVALPAAAQGGYKEGNDAYSAANKLYRAKKYSESGPAFLKMAQEYPGHPSADTAYYMAVYSAYLKRDADLAGRAATVHSQALPNGYYRSNSLYFAGYTYYQYKKDYKAAIPFFEELAFRMPGSSNRDSGRNYLVTCYQYLKEYEKALEICDRVLGSYGENKKPALPYMVRRIDMLGYLKRYDDIVAAAEDVQKVAPGTYYSAQAWEKAGHALYRATKLELSADAFLRAGDVSHYSNAELCLYMACVCRERLKDIKGALAICERHVKAFPGVAREADMRQRIASYYGRLKDLANEARVREEFDKRFPKSPQTPRNLWTLVSLYDRQKNADEAVKACERLIAAFPKTSQGEAAMYSLAARLSAKGQNERAAALCKQVIETAPNGSRRAGAEKLLEKLGQ